MSDKKVCPLNNFNLCEKENCQWWIAVYAREKGAGYDGRDKLIGIQNCAMVILAQKNAEGFIDV